MALKLKKKKEEDEGRREEEEEESNTSLCFIIKGRVWEKKSFANSARIRNLFYHKSVVVRGHHLFLLLLASATLFNFLC